MIFTGREKEAILPKALVESEMHLDDRVCMMPLCTMLKCTTARLFQADEILTAINDLVSRVGADVSEPLPLRFIYKLGCDGTGGMSQYNQNAADGSFVEDNKLFGNCNFFHTSSLIPVGKFSSFLLPAPFNHPVNKK